MVRRLTETNWYDYLLWFRARDEWSFDVDGVDFRVVNHWIGSTTLLKGATELAQVTKLIELSGKSPVLQAIVRTNGDRQRSIAIYFKGHFTVTMKVEVDGNDISNGFI